MLGYEGYEGGYEERRTKVPMGLGQRMIWNFAERRAVRVPVNKELRSIPSFFVFGSIAAVN